MSSANIEKWGEVLTQEQPQSQWCCSQRWFLFSSQTTPQVKVGSGKRGVHAIRNIIQHPRISIKRRIQEPNRLLSGPQSRLIQSRNNCRENWRTGRSTSIGGRITSGVNLSPMIRNFLNMSITSFGTYSIIIPIRTNIRNPSTNAIVNSITIPHNSSNIWYLTRIR